MIVTNRIIQPWFNVTAQGIKYKNMFNYQITKIHV